MKNNPDYHEIADRINNEPLESDVTNAYRYAIEDSQADNSPHVAHSERQALQWVLEGQIERIEESLKKQLADVITYRAYYSDSPKQHMEYSSVSAVSIFAAMAVISGVNEGFMKAIRSFYLQKVSKADTIEDYYKIAYQSMRDISMIIHDHIADSGGIPIVKRTKAYVRANLLSENLSLKTVAAELNISKDYLSKLFTREEEKTFTQYVNECKVYTAGVYLRSTDYSINEIAILSGFSSSSYLCRMFERIKGVSPTEYRKSRELYD